MFKDFDLTTAICVIAVCSLFGSIAYFFNDYYVKQAEMISKAQTCEGAVILEGHDVERRLMICKLGKVQ